MNTYLQKKEKLLSRLKKEARGGERGSRGQSQNEHSTLSISLDKQTSNLFRHRARQQNLKRQTADLGTSAGTKTSQEIKKLESKPISLRDFNQVIKIDTAARWALVEGLTTFDDLVKATLPCGLMPLVVPELKSITIGGAVSGIGIESSAFKYGLVHESVLEAEVLLPDGRITLATPQNEHADLFFGLPNSYGTLGYILSLKIKLTPTKKFVRLTHTEYTDAQKYFQDIEIIIKNKQQEIDFLDGTVFIPNRMYITTGKFIDHAPKEQISDYTYMNIYYKSIRRKKIDYLSVYDYIWRWDTDWFWCSTHFGVQNQIFRFLVGRKRLNSVNYWKVRSWWAKLTGHSDAKTDRQASTRAKKIESVVQDVEIPIERAAEFLDFFNKEIGIKPIWICPLRAGERADRFSLYPFPPKKILINFGFWDVVKSKTSHEPGHFNRLIEQKVRELGGKKSLYSTSYYTGEEFWQLFDKTTYDQLKAKYDPAHRQKDLYVKTVKAL